MQASVVMAGTGKTPPVRPHARESAMPSGVAPDLRMSKRGRTMRRRSQLGGGPVLVVGSMPEVVEEVGLLGDWDEAVDEREEEEVEVGGEDEGMLGEAGDLLLVRRRGVRESSSLLWLNEIVCEWLDGPVSELEWV